MATPDATPVPLNVRRAAESHNSARDGRIVRAAVELLVRDLRKLRATAGAPLGEHTPDQPGMLKEVLRRADVSQKSWYRIRKKEWAGDRLDQEIKQLARTVLDERRFAAALLELHHGERGLAPDDLIGGLALYEARSLRDPDIPEVLRVARARDVAQLLTLACKTLVRMDGAKPGFVLDRATRYHEWLQAIASEYTGGAWVDVAINGGERLLAGYVQGLRARGRPPELGDAEDLAGYWSMAVIESLVMRDEFDLADVFVEAEMGSARWDLSDHGVLNPAEYLLERLVIRVLTGPAKARATSEARTLARKWIRKLDAGEAPLPSRPPYLHRRTRAARHYLQREWKQALEYALQPGIGLVRPDVEEEYAFPLLAAIAQDTASRLRDLREPYTGAFLHSEVERGRGPFLDAPIRQMGQELVEYESVGQLADAVEQFLSQANCDALDTNVWELRIARTFNVNHTDYTQKDLLELGRRLRQRVAEIDKAVSRLEHWAAEA